MDVTVTKEYKDRLFRLVFQDKKDLLSLYNAVNKSSYENEKRYLFPFRRYFKSL